MPIEPASIHIDDDPELVDWIKKNPLYIFRAGKSLSLRRMAIKLNTTQTTISKWEDGTSYPTDENITKIAKVIGSKLDDLKKVWRDWYELRHPPTEQRNGKAKSENGNTTKDGK